MTTDESNTPPVCMLLLPIVRRLTARALEAALAGEAEILEVSNSGETAMLRLDGRLYTVMAMAAPIPMEAFAELLAQPQGAELRPPIEAHRAHFILSCLEPGVGFDDAVAAARGVTLLAERLGGDSALAAYWSASGQLVAREDLRALAAGLRAQPMTPPLRHWISIRLRSVEGRHGGATQGLAGFTGYEVNLTPISWPLRDVAARLLGVVSYIFQAGPVLRPGETLGVSAQERFRILCSETGLSLELEQEACA